MARPGGRNPGFEEGTRYRRDSDYGCADLRAQLQVLQAPAEVHASGPSVHPDGHESDAQLVASHDTSQPQELPHDTLPRQLPPEQAMLQGPEPHVTLSLHEAPVQVTLHEVAELQKILSLHEPSPQTISHCALPHWILSLQLPSPEQIRLQAPVPH